MNFFIKKLLLLSVVLFFSVLLFATDYYVSNAGNDNNTGTSTETAFLSIAKINGLLLQPGDRVLFRRGDIFRGELHIIYSGNVSAPIVIDAYGTGAQPVINGAAYVNGWEFVAGGVYVASTATNPAMLLHNNAIQTLSRFPNQGFLTMDVAGGTNGFTDNELTQPNDYFTGSQVHVRSARWRYEERTVASFSNNTVSFNTSVSFPLTAHWGYYFTNKREFIDQPSEYFYNENTQQLFLQTTNGQQPSDFTVEASAYDYGIRLDGADNITIQNIQFNYQRKYGVFAPGYGSNITIQNCTFKDIFNRAIGIINKNNVTIYNNQIDDMWSRGITFYGCTNVTITNNQIRNIGVGRPGMATDDDLPYVAVQLDRSSGTIRNNFIDRVGYTAIRFYKNTVIENNVIDNFCLTTDDGGGIYTYGPKDKSEPRNGTGCIIRKNIVRNARGNSETTNNEPVHVDNIFMDDNSGNAIIENNTLYNSEGKGIFLHNSSGNTVRNNNVFDCKVGCIAIEHDLAGDMPSDNSVYGNIFYAIYANASCAIVANYDPNSSGLNFGTFNDNYYFNPYNITPIYNAEWGVEDGSFKLMEKKMRVSKWRELKDAAAQESFVSWDDFAVTSTNGSNLITNGNFDANSNGWDCFPYGVCNTTWEAGGLLDGGYVRTSNATQNFGAIYNTNYFPVSQQQQYLMTYSIIGSENNTHGVELLDGFNYSTIANTQVRGVNTTRSNHKMLIKPISSTNNARANFRVGPDFTTGYWIDNISLVPVNTAPLNPNNRNFIFVNESTQPATVTLSDSYYDVKGATVSGAITIPAYDSQILLAKEEDAQPTISSISISDITAVYENAATISVKVCLSTPSSVPVNVQYQSAGGSAINGVDYILGNGTITIPAGQTCANIDIGIVADNENEPSEFFLLQLFNAQNATISREYGVVNIINTNAAPQPSLSLGDLVTTESAGTVQLSICLSEPSNQNVAMQYEPVGGSATSGVDFIAPGGSISIPAGQTCTSLQIQVIADNVDEATEYQLFRVFNASNATISDEYGVLSIINENGSSASNLRTIAEEARLSKNSLVKVKLQPNPFISSLEVDVYATKENNVELVVTDIYGRVELERKAQLKKGKNSLVLGEFNNQKPGTYFMRLIVAGRVEVFKVMKMSR